MAGSPMEHDDDVKVALLLAKVFEELEIPYFVVGSLASAYVGEPRSTNDVDVVVDLHEEKLNRLAERLASDFYFPVPAAQQAVARKASFNVIHLATAFKVDLFVAGNEPYPREQMKRARPIEVASNPPRFLRLASAEDVLLNKLNWYRKGGGSSDRQWRDILGVFKVQGNRLDSTYLEKWAPHLRVQNLLRRANTEADAE